MKWQWRRPLSRLLVLSWIVVSTANVASNELEDVTTEPWNWETETGLPATGVAPQTTASTAPPPEPFPYGSDESSARVPDFRFTRTSYNATIPENSVWKTNVVPDEKMGIYVTEEVEGVRYKITDGDRDRFFKAEERVVGNFCFLVIRTRSSNDVLNRERKDRYVIEVRATATNAVTKEQLEANATVVISVLDVNDLKPLFFQSEYEKVVPEDMPLHKSVLKMQAEDADLGRNGEIYYSFLESTEQFGIHPTSGIVSLTRPLKYLEKSSYELTVVGRDRGYAYRGSSGKLSTAKLTLRVREVNLHAPEIYVQHLPELVENSNSRLYAIVRVTDKDEGPHGEIESLEIVDGDPDGHFRVKKTNPGEYALELLKGVDRESRPKGYNLTLRATDGGTPQRQSYKSVPVKVVDMNDNAPVFDREIYEVNVPETAPVNTPVIRLKVTDEDSGRNSQVYLEIVGGNEGNEFRLNPETGMLYSAVPLDAEDKPFYTLTVSAIDQGNYGTRKQSSAKVKINVIDMNDNDPTFDKPEMSVVVDENEPAGTTVLKVTAKDRDSGENAYISYSIANLNRVPFEIDHFSGVIRTTQVLDYESMKRNYVLRVRASDWGLPFRRQTEMQVRIKLKDINDNRPQFEKVDCSGHVPRYLPIGSEILTLSAIDFDADNIISYRLISGNEDNCFSLDSNTGVLSVTCDLMDVKVAERTLNVTATDGTHFADVTKVTVHLVTAKRNAPVHGRLVSDDLGAFECRDTGVARRLTEVLAAAERNNVQSQNREEFAMMPSRYGENVHAPELIAFPVEIRVNESAPLGTRLGVIRARDRDLGYNGKLVFGISGGDHDSVFRIDPDTGELKIIGYLDRERVDEYLLNVTVYDLGKPQKSSSRILPITILDVNDNPPRFEKSVASFRVSENASNGTAIFRVNATDRDLGDNGKVTYSLVTDTNDFEVDPSQGVVFVSGALDRERQDLYELKIRASDAGKPPLHSEALVRVQIDDVNDNPPSFALAMHFVRVREDVPVGSVVAVVGASDPDLGEGGEVRYSLAGESDVDGLFTIDKQSGTIRTAKELDFEDRQVHSLVVRARDKGTPSLYSEATVVVEVVDVNENVFPPVFKDFVVSASVKENQPVDTLVTTVTATDADPPGDDSKVSYFIRGGDGIGLFTIDDEGECFSISNPFTLTFITSAFLRGRFFQGPRFSKKYSQTHPRENDIFC
ncbi:UNVERIFIED_CONTAM: hypothetical protein PYX00_006035 [Menopon gallinae]|uniref:Cadherin domain-containing protein n=1 Tax=Menopon gallinae TaxID=328185 RepID=A0AAW2HUW7_9NEOP